MGTSLLGSLTLSNDESLVMVWREIGTPALEQFPLPQANAKRLTSDALPPFGDIAAFLWAEDPDGVPWLLLGRFDEPSARRFREVWNQTVGGPVR